MTPNPAHTTPDLILDAADRLLGRLGFKKTTLDDLARESGVGRRTIYLHFASKEDVALASIDRVVTRLVARLDALAVLESSAADRLRAMIVDRVLYRIDAVSDYYHGLDELFAVLRPAYMERRQRYFEAEEAVFARVLRAGQKTGELETRNVARTARALLLSTNALLPYSLSPRELGARELIQRDAEAIAECLLAGLLARPISSARVPKRARTNPKR